MNASILLPSREKPNQFRVAVESVFKTAGTHVEVIARVDEDDPLLQSYIDLRVMVTRLIIGPRLTGYGSNHVFYEDCAKLSRGDVLVLWNDDMQMETKDWDLVYKKSFESHPGGMFLPATAHISSPSEGRGGHYQWACAAISRPMYEAMGVFAIGGDPSIDRCYEALARQLGGWLRPDVWINHDYQHTFEGTRGEHYAACHKEWGTRSANWDRIGKEFAQRVHDYRIKH